MIFARRESGKGSQDHTVGFRGSPAFADWRAIVVLFFAASLVIEHVTLLTKSH